MTNGRLCLKNLFFLFNFLLFVFLSASFLWIGAGTVKELALIKLFSNTTGAPSFLFAIFILAMLLFFWHLGFSFIESKDSLRTQYILAAVLFACMLSFFLVLLLCFRVNLRNDCYQDVDTAAYLTDHSYVPLKNKHPGELLPFGNNYFFILATSVILRLLFFWGVSDVVCVLQGINALAMMLGVFFTWLFIKECFSIKAANRVLLMSVFNPLFYGFTFWYYSNSLSIPVMMAIPLVGLRLFRLIKDEEATLKHCLFYGILMGVLCFLGFAVRPTVVFPLIAMSVLAIFFLPVFIENKKKTALSGLSFALSAIILFSAFSSVRTSYFHEVIPFNRPITYWLAMGAHGDGNKSSKEDALYVKSLSNDENKTLLCLKRALDHYEENGIKETLKLWLKKTAFTWSDGYGQISRRIIAGRTESSLLSFFAGKNSDLFELYCQIYRLAIIMGAFIFCAVGIKKKNHRLIHITIAVTLAGGIVFYMLWEARGVYSAPFVPALVVLAESGLCSLYSLNLPFKESLIEKRIFLLLFVFLALFAGEFFYKHTGALINASHYRIYTKGKLRHYHPITKKGILAETANSLQNPDYTAEGGEDSVYSPSEGYLLPDTISQDFYAKKAFNRLVLPVYIPDKKIPLSSYLLSVSSDDGEILFQKEEGAEDVHRGNITVSFSPISGKRHYILTIKKLQPHKGDIMFFSKYDSYHIGAYEGSLKIDGQEGFVNDLALSVAFTAKKEPYLSLRLRLLLSVMLVVASWLIIYGIAVLDNILPYRKTTFPSNNA